MSPNAAPDPGARVRHGAAALVATMAGAQLAAALRGPFRADDWINLEQGARAWSAGWRDTWTGLNPFTLYRPLVDVWHGAMLRLFGLEAPPMLAVMIALLLLQTWLLARLVRARGGSREAAALAMAAAWAQPNTYSWTTLWVSNVTGSLMTTFGLLALLAHHRAVRVSARGGSPLPAAALVSAAFVLGALCKEETVLLVPIVAALEATRWHRHGAPARRGAVTSWAVLAAVALAYVVFRTQVLPTPQEGASRYHLVLGAHVLKNAAFYAAHLVALPMVALGLARLLLPAAFSRTARTGDDWARAREAMLAGFAWAAIALTLYLPIQGRPAYGYLYAPGLAVAFAVAHALAWAASVQADRRRSAVMPVAMHAGLALALTAAALAGIGWHRYRELTRATFEVLDRDLPAPAPGTRVLFLDVGAGETFSGRSLFNLMFDDATGPLLRLHYGRRDLDASAVHGPAAAAAALDTTTAGAVFEAKLGRIVRIAKPLETDRADRPSRAGLR